MSRKMGTSANKMVYPERWVLLIPSFKTSLCCRQIKRYMSKIPSVTGIMCAKCQKLQHMYVIGLILLLEV